jgi:nucleoside-diphosphate-sugar epimerase
MRFFVTGASGWIGSHVTTELLQHGHEVVGLARSDDSATAIEGLGAEVQRGTLADLDVLGAAARDSDGVIHLGFHHDFSDMAGAAALDAAALDAFADALAGTGKPLLFASGTLGFAPGRPVVEDDQPDPDAHPRMANAVRTVSRAAAGLKPVALRFPPTVHGQGDHGFVAVLVEIAKRQGSAAYVGDGANRWSAVHVTDAARLVRRAAEDPSATVAHAIAEEGITTKELAEAIGAGLGLPVVSLAPEQAPEHFGWMAWPITGDAAASSAQTRVRWGWEPTGPTLLADLPHYL